MDRKKVLLVDDDNLLCWGLEKEFAGLGHYIRVVENGANALSELRRQQYDTVFLDIRLPDANGLELLPEIGRLSPDAKIIIMSGNASETNRQIAFDGGAVKFLEKPFDLSYIHGILTDALAGHLRKREHKRHACNIPLRITIVKTAPGDKGHDIQDLTGMMTEFGFGGFRLRTKNPIAVGQIIRAYVAAAKDYPAVKPFPPQATAEVVWVSPANDCLTAGVKFLS